MNLYLFYRDVFPTENLAEPNKYNDNTCFMYTSYVNFIYRGSYTSYLFI